MDRRTGSIYKGIIWGLLEMYLSKPACDLDGELLDLHETDDERSFCNNKGYSTCKLNPKFIERLNVTNAFAQCRDKGIISKSEYHFVKDRLASIGKEMEMYDVLQAVWKKYGIPVLAVEYHYNRVMNKATEAMIPILYPRQWAIVEEAKGQPLVEAAPAMR